MDNSGNSNFQDYSDLKKYFGDAPAGGSRGWDDSQRDVTNELTGKIRGILNGSSSNSDKINQLNALNISSRYAGDNSNSQAISQWLQRGVHNAVVGLGKEDIDSQVSGFKTQFDSVRASGEQNLIQSLTEYNKREFGTVFQPKIRQALNAQGILFGGAQTETEALAKSQLEGGLLGAQQSYEAGTAEGDVQLEQQKTQAELGLEQDQTLQDTSQRIADASNALANALNGLAVPNPTVAAIQGFAQMSPFLFSLLGGSRGGGGSSIPADLFSGPGVTNPGGDIGGVNNPGGSFLPPSLGLQSSKSSSPYSTEAYKGAFGY